MNSSPRYSNSRQGSVEANGSSIPSTVTSAAQLQHPYLSSSHSGLTSHSPSLHSPLYSFGHTLASLPYSPSSISSMRAGQPPVPNWSPVNPSIIGSLPVSSNPIQTSKVGYDDDDDDDDDDEDGSSSDDAQEDRLSDPQTKKRAPVKRKRNPSSPQADKSKKSASANNKLDDKNTAGSSSAQPTSKKPKPTRGAKACTNCRRLKMRCVGAENGPPCNRCANGNHECVFEQSNRGKKSGKNQKAEAMQQSLKKMEQTLATVLRSIREPGIAAQNGGMVTRSPSPAFGSDPDAYRKDTRRESRLAQSFGSDEFPPRSPWTRSDGPDAISTHDISSAARSSSSVAEMVSPVSNTVNPSAVNHPSASSHEGSTSSPATHGTRFLEPLPHHRYQHHQPMSQDSRSHAYNRTSSRGSPRLHSLPDNTLNPLGLLAEASLRNNYRMRRQATVSSAGSSNRERDSQVSASTSGHSPDKNVKSEGEMADSAAANSANDGNPVQEGDDGNAASPNQGSPGAPLGVASGSYFKPGPMTILPIRRIIIEREIPPELLTHGIVTSEEVLELFRIFFHHCSQHLLLFDADWHTPTFICSRSPFLFTCICTVASKFYTRRSDLHQTCLTLVKKVAFDVMSRGFKSIEIVQGFLLLSMWNQPARRFEEDKTWLFSGIAIRMATDLNLHRKSVATFSGNPSADDPAVLDREREILNRERTWYICFIVDRSISAQMGKPYTVREDWIVRNCRNWGSRFSRIWDIGISALVDLHRIHSRQLDFLYSSTTTVSGLNTEIDYSLVLPIFNEQLEEWRELWRWRGLFNLPPQSVAYLEKQKEKRKRRMEAAKSDRNKDVQTDGHGNSDNGACGKDHSTNNTGGINAADDDDDDDGMDHNSRIMVHVVKQAPLRFNYAVLVLNSFGLQQSLDHPHGGGLDRAQYFAKCMEAAKNMVTTARDELFHSLRYASDAQFVTLAYACVFLLKLIRPVFSNYVDEESVVTLVQDTVDLLDEVAVNETHTPALYAQFLKALLQARTELTVGSKSANNSRAHSRASSTRCDEEQTNEGETATSAPHRAEADASGRLAGPSSTEGVAGGGNGSGLDLHHQHPQPPHTTHASLDPVFHLDPADTSHSAGMSTVPNATIAAPLPWGDAPFPGMSTGMEDFWGSLLPPGFAQQPSMQDMFDASDPLGTGLNQNVNQYFQSKFGMGGGGVFEFDSGAIAVGKGGGTATTPMASNSLSGANTPHVMMSRRSSASQILNNLTNVTFDFTA